MVTGRALLALSKDPHREHLSPPPSLSTLANYRPLGGRQSVYDPWLPTKFTGPRYRLALTLMILTTGKVLLDVSTGLRIG